MMSLVVTMMVAVGALPTPTRPARPAVSSLMEEAWGGGREDTFWSLESLDSLSLLDCLSFVLVYLLMKIF